jgi:hypothetical protein
LKPFLPERVTKHRLPHERTLQHPESKVLDPPSSADSVVLSKFSEQICEVEGDGVRYVLRKNEKEAARERHRLEDKLEKLVGKIATRNEHVKAKPRCQPEAGQRAVEPRAGSLSRPARSAGPEYSTIYSRANCSCPAGALSP